MVPWPHQERAHQESRRLFAAGASQWVIVGPCGSGKSLEMERIAIPAAEAGKRVAVYSYRVLLTRQLKRGFTKAGADFGIVAAGFEDDENKEANIQICSLQTVNSRLGNPAYDFPPADIIIVDEAHQQTGEMADNVFGEHFERGAKAKIGFTATPVSLAGHYDHLVDGGSYSEMLKCGAHLPIHCYGPDRPDLSGISTDSNGGFTEADNRRINPARSIIGRVYDNWKRLNPDALPAIGFAVGVPEARGHTEEFFRRGVPAGSISGDRVTITERANGKLVLREYQPDESSRTALIMASKTGDIKIVWNRFVLREAVDMPWLFHAISATSMGAVSTWIQSIGRVMRFWPHYNHVVLQDHGGNIDRHGPPDMDRDWSLGCTNNSIHRAEVKSIQEKKGPDAEPICCPKCSAYRLSGPACPQCGHIHKMSSRLVREMDGKLVRKVGRAIKHKPPKNYDDVLRSALYGAWATKKTVKQAFTWAVMTAEKQNIPIEPMGRVYILPKGDPRWNNRVRDVYPTYKPKHMA